MQTWVSVSCMSHAEVKLAEIPAAWSCSHLPRPILSNSDFLGFFCLFFMRNWNFKCMECNLPIKKCWNGTSNIKHCLGYAVCGLMESGWWGSVDRQHIGNLSFRQSCWHIPSLACGKGTVQKQPLLRPLILVASHQWGLSGVPSNVPFTVCRGGSNIHRIKPKWNSLLYYYISL